ncbi:MAG: carotenoid 1,2-hydratase, partial [Gammaproteobacteria bacterium]|nr:carotenoid 1,2-hydratase [Gammaproteobacteria bacterium]
MSTQSAGVERSCKTFPDFDRPVPDNGYAWWYLDAISDCGDNALTVIGFIGSVFSPFYARARKVASSDPREYSAMNVVLYGRGGHRWTLTERGRAQLQRSATHLAIGPSSMQWEGDALTVEIAETTCPLPRAVRGQLKLYPTGLAERTLSLDEHGRHQWRPIAPIARVEVELRSPVLRWTGSAYLDSNWGEQPLEQAFARWSWSRSVHGSRTALFYDVETVTRQQITHALLAHPDGHLESIPPPETIQLPRSIWRMPRPQRSEAANQTAVLRTLEDAPFYSRSRIRTRVDGLDGDGIHESLSLARFDSTWVQLMLPYRMPRAPHAGGQDSGLLRNLLCPWLLPLL